MEEQTNEATQTEATQMEATPTQAQVTEATQAEVTATDYTDRLLYHKALAVAQALAGDSIDVKDEINFVNGLSINDKGEVEGTAHYRPHPSTVQAPAQKRIEKPRAAANATPAKDDAYFANLVKQYGI